jgi:threonine 3-dehydrogenase
MEGKMKAVLKEKPEPGFVVTEVDIPKVGPGELLVKVKRAAICGTDSHIYAWDAWSASRIKPPLIVGHEFCGDVVEVGPNVTGFEVGDYVSAESHIPCGYCYQCNNDQQHICGNLRILGVDTDGCFAEYAKIPATVAWKNPPDMDPDVAAVQEPLGNSVYAVLAEEDVAGRAVAVFGCGSAGMFSTAVAHAAGAYPVISVIKHEFRRHIMEELGSDLVLHYKDDDVVTRITERTKGVGVDIVMEMTGNQTAIEQGSTVVRKGGRFTAFGIPSGPITLDLASLVF